MVAVACSRTPQSAGPRVITAVDQRSGTTALLIAVSPVDERTVWVSGSAGTWLRTTDGGATWQTGRVPGADSLQFRDVHAVDANTAFLLSIGDGPQSRIYKTADAGAHWTLQFTNPDPKGFYDCMAFWDANRGVAIGDALGNDVAMLTTTDGGAHWTRIPPSSLPPAMPNEGSFAASGTCLVTRPGGHAWAVASNPNHGRVLHSADYGRTWRVDTLPITTHEGLGSSIDLFPRRAPRHRTRRREQCAGRRRARGVDERRRTNMDGSGASAAQDRRVGRRLRAGRRATGDRRGRAFWGSLVG